MDTYLYGPEPIGMAVSSSSVADSGTILATARRLVAMEKGWFRVNLTVSSSTASTESMKLSMEVYRLPSAMERSKEEITSWEVTGVPSENFAPSRRSTSNSVSEDQFGSPAASAG